MRRVVPQVLPKVRHPHRANVHPAHPAHAVNQARAVVHRMKLPPPHPHLRPAVEPVPA